MASRNSNPTFRVPAAPVMAIVHWNGKLLLPPTERRRIGLFDYRINADAL
jgi:hypothetical protein|tara:strand:- start:1119 stop:1268 length:150 start_codon:yes stop_codon:yes gene_type:complete